MISPLETYTLLIVKSVQATKPIALTGIFTLTKGQTVMINTDSRYVPGICCAIGTIWKSCSFLASAGIPIANGHVTAAQLQAIHLPTKIAIVYFPCSNDFKDQAQKSCRALFCHSVY